jgi:hypothetical protein
MTDGTAEAGSCGIPQGADSCARVWATLIRLSPSNDFNVYVRTRASIVTYLVGRPCIEDANV